MKNFIKCRNLISVITLAVTIAVCVGIFTPTKSFALTSSDFDPGHIIDDAIFTNKNSMSVQDIQNFLNSKVQTCDSNHAGYTGTTGAVYNPSFVCLKDFYENPNSTYTIHYTYTDTSGNPQTGTRTYYYNNAYQYTALCPVYGGYNPSNFTCGSGDYHNGIDHLIATIQSVGGVVPSGAISAAQIIYNAAQTYNINPQVLIVLLQKEQGLVTDTWPVSWEYQSAAGYGCPDTSPCSSNYAGFSNQIANAAWQFQQYLNHPNNYNYVVGTNYIQYNPNANCGGSNVTIQNQATAALYDYTPYQPNAAALSGMNDSSAGGGDGCSAYGNRNFFWYFSTWFGTTYAFIYNGVSYSNVFDPEYYLNNYPDLKTAFGNDEIAAFNHFIYYGMSEGRQASANFNVTSYRNRYPDLRFAFGTNLPAYYLHYITNGKAEGRTATGTVTLQPVTSYKGIDYSSVYNYTTYLANYADIRQKYANDDTGALLHFIGEGMSEGRQASADFNVYSYEGLYYDLRRAFGSNLPAYYLHYITNGKAEGRTGTSTYLGGVSSYNGIDYSSVYNFNDYSTINSDIRSAFGLDDAAALQHFINYGMSEGRQASTQFNVFTYKNRYPDLQRAFGDNLKLYYLHYITNGKAEGRSGI